MPEYLSQGWIDSADAAVAAAAVRATSPVVVQNLVTDDSGEIVSYHVDIDPSGARIRAGEHPEPTVTYKLTSVTATGIASGSLDPYAEFMAGRLEVSGDTSALVENQHLIDAIGAAVASVETT